MRYNKDYHINLPWDKYKISVEKWLHLDGGIQFKKKLNDFAAKMGVHFNMVRIKDVKTLWGSCSSKKNLNFNRKLFLLPEKLIDYICVHELAHLKQMNHSEKFWKEVEKLIPDYRERRAELKRYV